MVALPSQNGLVITSEQIALLERLSNACGVSGYEDEVREIVLNQIRPYVDEIKIDTLGNVLAIRNAKINNPLRVMLDAHMDEVGFMIVEEENDGFFRFETVGGIDERLLIAKPVWVGKQHVPGIIGYLPVHLFEEKDKRNTISIQDLRIDLGQGGAKLVKPGDWATFATSFQIVGQSLRGKALDNRLGVATVIELVKVAPRNIELLVAFTVQEEIGLRGARVAAYGLNPDLAIVMDSTPAYDLPLWDGSENEVYNTRLDHGAAIYVVDGVTVSDPRLVRFLIQIANELKISFQIRQPGGGGTDAGSIHQQKTGIPSVSISVPGRYAHTGVMLARLSDWECVMRLVYAGLERINREVF